MNAKILIDADVVIHFYKGGYLRILHTIFNHKIYILDKVIDEIRFDQMKDAIKELLIDKKFVLMEFPEGNEDIKKEYYYIKKTLDKGDGESACMAVARFTKDIIASSNLKDIKIYCERHQINYLTTCYFLFEAYKLSILTFDQCNLFIQEVLNKGSKLPFDHFQALLNHYKK